MSIVKTLLGEGPATATPHQPTSTIPKSDVWSAVKYVYDTLAASIAALSSVYQPLDTELTALASTTSAANKVPYFTGSGTATTADFTAYGRSVVAVADEAAFKALVNLEIGTDVQAYDADLTTWAGLTPSANAQSLVTAANYAAMRALLDLEAGTDFNAYDATLASLAAYNTNGLLTQTAADTFTGRTITGTASEITVTDGNGVAGNPTLALHAGVYRASGTDVALADGGTGASLADPGADRIMFWDDSESAVTWLTASTGLAISTTSIAISTSTVLSWTGQQTFAEATLTDGANIAWALNTQQAAKVTLGGNRTLDAATNQVAGGVYVLRIIQDGSGGRTLSFNANYLFPNGTDPTLSTGIGDKDVLVCHSDGTNMFCVINQDFS
jgi:hypothetical protein